ncbi:MULTISPECIES: MCE family protein [Alphaproteobacteria]|uniref:ABC transporter substrate-binding protein n=2 Tax=Alphaproteobacteria TaxID=28211 RepID=A0A512HCH4_9HYPH|nr:MULTISPECIES: MlaD family protein [Alphaproteobacteria]GEO83144.1 ABC transporter substrate-binding protein [Ciceribacter naphthalenivorans]GLR20461.1 ABC transporter substrate-binding protein [Ciceribacter naphthalenivorans]GLT03317.1 ABC transporter substrate-binding protein [Sphingomonas psychrolutea]
METKANYAIVGFFTVLVIAAAFGFVYWMAEYGRGGTLAPLAIRIPGSANGLSIGSPVRFNGIAVGSVRSLYIDKEDPEFSVAFTEVRADAPVTAQTKAVLEIQGLTGAAYIELSGGNASDENILEKAIATGKPAVLLADQSSVTNLLATADKILKRADDAIGQLQGFITDARAPLTNTVKNAETFSKSLADNASGIDKFLQSVSLLSESISGLSGRLDSTLGAAESLFKALNSDKIDEILANTAEFTGNFAEASDKIGPAIENFRDTAATFQKFGENADKTLARVDEVVAAIDAQKISTVMNDVSAASADAREAVAGFKDLSQSMNARTQDIDQAITDFTQLANKLNNASDQIDGILTKVDSFLGSGEANSLSVEARKTLQSIRGAADNLNSKIGPIADNLTRFSNTGLRDIQSLVTDTRQTVRGLNDAITNFDQNPQRLLFGGENVKQYDGRMRR